MNIKYANRKGELVHVDEVENGLKCECICVSCGEELVAKNKGEIKEHHFSHKSGTECENGYETLLHFLAKEVIKSEKQIMIPELHTLSSGYGNPLLLGEEHRVQIKEVKLERRYENIIPDVLVEYGENQRMFIEINVTHAVDDEKMKQIEKLKVDTIEISLDRDTHYSYDDIKKIILDGVNEKEWLYSNKRVELTEKLKECSEKKLVISRGLALHIDDCPLSKRVYEGQTYANYIDNCLYCRFNLLDDINSSSIHCFGKAKITNGRELENITDVNKEGEVIKSISYRDGSVAEFPSDSNEKTLSELWYANNQENFLALNVNTNVAVYIAKSPDFQLKKYNKCYGEMYKNGYNLGSREIYGADRRQWKIIPRKEKDD